MRISLIGPKWNEMINSYPPLGLGYLAAIAEQDGHEVRIHDFGLYPSQPTEVDAQQVVDYQPDLVAFTSMTTSYHYVEQLVALLKSALGVPVIIGGPTPPRCPKARLATQISTTWSTARASTSGRTSCVRSSQATPTGVRSRACGTKKTARSFLAAAASPSKTSIRCPTPHATSSSWINTRSTRPMASPC